MKTDAKDEDEGTCHGMEGENTKKARGKEAKDGVAGPPRA